MRSFDALTSHAKAAWTRHGREVAKAHVSESIITEHGLTPAVAWGLAEDVLRGDRASFERVVGGAAVNGGVRFLGKSADEKVMWIFGPASVAVSDKENELITGPALAKALPELLRAGRLSISHLDILTGEILPEAEVGGKLYKTEVRPVTKEDLEQFELLRKAEVKEGTDALFLVGKIWGDREYSLDLQKEIERGEMRAFSISGQALREGAKVICDENSFACKTVNVIDDIALSACTICSEGMNQAAGFVVLKRDANGKLVKEETNLMLKAKSCGCGGDCCGGKKIEKAVPPKGAEEHGLPLGYPKQPSHAKTVHAAPSKDAATKQPTEEDEAKAQAPAGRDRASGSTNESKSPSKRPHGFMEDALGAFEKFAAKRAFVDAMRAIEKAQWQWDPTPDGRPRATRAGFGGHKQYVYDDEAVRLTSGSRGPQASIASVTHDPSAWVGSPTTQETSPKHAAVERERRQVLGDDIPEPAYEVGAVVSDVADGYEDAAQAELLRPEDALDTSLGPSEPQTTSDADEFGDDATTEDETDEASGPYAPFESEEHYYEALYGLAEDLSSRYSDGFTDYQIDQLVRDYIDENPDYYNAKDMIFDSLQDWAKSGDVPYHEDWQSYASSLAMKVAEDDPFSYDDGDFEAAFAAERAGKKYPTEQILDAAADHYTRLLTQRGMGETDARQVALDLMESDRERVEEAYDEWKGANAPPQAPEHWQPTGEDGVYEVPFPYGRATVTAFDDGTYHVSVDDGEPGGMPTEEYVNSSEEVDAKLAEWQTAAEENMASWEDPEEEPDPDVEPEATQTMPVPWDRDALRTFADTTQDIGEHEASILLLNEGLPDPATMSDDEVAAKVDELISWGENVADSQPFYDAAQHYQDELDRRRGASSGEPLGMGAAAESGQAEGMTRPTDSADNDMPPLDEPEDKKPGAKKPGRGIMGNSKEKMDEDEEVVPEDELVQKPGFDHSPAFVDALSAASKSAPKGKDADEWAHLIANSTVRKEFSRDCRACFKLHRKYEDPIKYFQVIRKAIVDGRIAYGALTAHDHRIFKREWPTIKAECERAFALAEK